MSDRDRWNDDRDRNADRETAWHGEDRRPPNNPELEARRGYIRDDDGRRNEDDGGRYGEGRRYGAGDYENTRSWPGDDRRYGAEERWRPYDPGHDSPAYRDQSSGQRWRGEAGPSARTGDWRDWRNPRADEGRAWNGREERGFWDRTRDEVASWFGDRGAETRRRVDGEHRGRGPRGYRRADERISDDVHDRLTEDSWLDASDIVVNVREGEVVLSGRVRTREDKRRAEDLAERVSGVAHVQNNLRADDPRAPAWSPIPPSYPF
jgi:hypothetical protein